MSAQTCVQAAFILICVAVALSGKHPPALAQSLPDAERRQIHEDDKQDGDIAKLQADLHKLEDRTQKQWDAVNAMRDNSAGQQTETRTIATLLGGLQGLNYLLVQRDRKRRKQDSE